MRVFVTGADGFVGTHLCTHLKACGDDVYEARGPGTLPTCLDVLDRDGVLEAIRRYAPTAVVHLAGVSFVGQSHDAPGATFQVNAVGAVNLLEAVRRTAPRARVLLVGSGEMYGPVDVGSAATESSPLRPTSPYSASKVAAEVAGFQFARSYQLEVVSARPFNHLGRGQGARFVVPTFSRQLQAIRAGAEPKLVVGDLSPVRDFSHVDDVVEGYRLLLERGVPGEAYNIASGRGFSIREILDLLMDISGVHVTPEIDPARIRPTELPNLVGDPAKLRALGWRPTRSVVDALRDALDEAARCGATET